MTVALAKCISCTQVLCGNKCDLEMSRAVSQQEGEGYAAQVNIPFFETSAKDDINVHEAIHELIRRTPRLRGKEYKIVTLGKLYMQWS